MTQRSRGFWARLFGGPGPKAPPEGLFPPRPAPPADVPRPLLPPAPLPGLFLASPHEKRSLEQEPPSEPPPPPQPPPPPVSAEIVVLAAPQAAPAPPAAVEPAPLLLAAPEKAAPAPQVAPIPVAPIPVVHIPVVQSPLSVAEAEPDAEPAPITELIELSDLAAAATAREQPGFAAGELVRVQVAPPAAMLPPLPLLEGTAGFASDWIGQWHRQPRKWPVRDVACYFANDAIVSGSGQIWLDGRLVTAPEMLPRYVYKHLGIAAGGTDLLLAAALPLRTIAGPCVVLQAHGVHVYGHFLIEMLLRILLARRALHGMAHRYLLESNAPPWLLRILHEDLGIAADAIAYFDPRAERVRLREAVIPAMVHRDEGFHPVANDLIDDLLGQLGDLSREPPTPRPFIVRGDFQNPDSAARRCVNEAELIALAQSRHGFTPVNVEDLPWREQLALFRHAEIIVGLFGSGLHTAMVTPPGRRIVPLGLLNMVQSEIAALRGHRIAYLTEGFIPKGNFTIDPDAFRRLLDAVCATGDQASDAA